MAAPVGEAPLSYSSPEAKAQLLNATPEDLGKELSVRVRTSWLRAISLIAVAVGVVLLAIFLYGNVYNTYYREPRKGDFVRMRFLASPAYLQHVVYNQPQPLSADVAEVASQTVFFCDLPMQPEDLGKRTSWLDVAGTNWNQNDKLCQSVSTSAGVGVDECKTVDDCLKYVACDPDDKQSCPIGIQCVKNSNKSFDEMPDHYCEYNKEQGEAIYACGERGDGKSVCLLSDEGRNVCPKISCNVGSLPLNSQYGESNQQESASLKCKAENGQYAGTYECFLAMADNNAAATSISDAATGCQAGQWCQSTGNLSKDAFDGTGVCTGDAKLAYPLFVEFEAEGEVIGKKELTGDQVEMAVDWQRVRCVYPWTAQQVPVYMDGQSSGPIVENDVAFHQNCLLTKDMVKGNPAILHAVFGDSVKAEAYLMNPKGGEDGSPVIPDEMFGNTVRADDIGANNRDKIWPLKPLLTMKTGGHNSSYQKVTLGASCDATTSAGNLNTKVVIPKGGDALYQQDAQDACGFIGIEVIDEMTLPDSPCQSQSRNPNGKVCSLPTTAMKRNVFF